MTPVPRPHKLLHTVFLLAGLLTATDELCAEENHPLRISRQQPRINPDLRLAHQHLENQSIDAARAAYEKALLNEPHNLDVLLALAGIAERQSRYGEAQLYREKAIIADPLDAAAQAAFLGRSDSSPMHAESRLKTLLTRNPQSAPVHFALGNIYARQKRWREAQAAYFNAVTGDQGNPDYLFNLAVSLEQLGLTQAASNHYRQALSAARTRPAGFNPQLIEQRLRELST